MGPGDGAALGEERGRLSSEVVPAALEGERLDRFVSLVTDVSRARAVELIADGAVEVDGLAAKARSFRLSEGQEVVITLPAIPDLRPKANPSVELSIVHEDPDVVVVDKMPGTVVHPGAGTDERTLVHGLLARYPEIGGVGDPDRPGIVHRLDKGTSGLLMVARTQLSYESLVDQLRERTARRSYDALVWGRPQPDRGVVDAPISRSSRRKNRMAVEASGRDARTEYQIVAAFDHPEACSLLRCNLETGRTHQIRVHMAAIGHPVVGDELYGGTRPSLEALRPMLHAAVLTFVHPRTGEELSFSSPRPADFEELLANLR